MVLAPAVSLALVTAACSSSSSPAPASSPPRSPVLTINHSAYRFVPVGGLAWYVLPAVSAQRKCTPSCSARVVHPAFRSAAIASVDTVPQGGGGWRLIIQLRPPAAAKLVTLTHHHRRGSQIVIGVARQLLVHAPLREPIVSGVWQISDLRYRAAVAIASQLDRIAVGYPQPRHQHRHHHHRRHRHHKRQHRRRHHRRHHH